jgi:hypothetical protein
VLLCPQRQPVPRRWKCLILSVNQCRVAGDCKWDVMGSEPYGYVQLVVEYLEQLRASQQFPADQAAVVPVRPGWQSGCCIAFSCS